MPSVPESMSLCLLSLQTPLTNLLVKLRFEEKSVEVQNQSFEETSDKVFSFPAHVAFTGVQPVPGDLGRFLIAEIVDSSRFPSSRISVSAPCRSNLASAERYFYWFLLSSHSQCLSVFKNSNFYSKRVRYFCLEIFLHYVCSESYKYVEIVEIVAVNNKRPVSVFLDVTRAILYLSRCINSDKLCVDLFGGALHFRLTGNFLVRLAGHPK